jgi:hypothetical protein
MRRDTSKILDWISNFNEVNKSVIELRNGVIKRNNP